VLVIAGASLALYAVAMSRENSRKDATARIDQILAAAFLEVRCYAPTAAAFTSAAAVFTCATPPADDRGGSGVAVGAAHLC
jgi:hypothetical protein